MGFHPIPQIFGSVVIITLGVFMGYKYSLTGKLGGTKSP